jgi:uncharacterized membrane protein
MTDVAGRSRTDNAPLWAPGLTLGAVAAAAMTGPSLFPKDPKLQRIGIVAAAAIGMGVGTGVEGISRGVDGVLPGDRLTAQLTVGGTGVALAAGMAIATRGHATGWRAGLQTGGILLAAGSAAGAASTLLARADEHVPGHDAFAQGALSASAGAAMLGFAMHNASLAKGGSYLLPDLPELASDASTFGTLAIDRGRGVRGALVAGGEGSLISWAKMPGQGQRFLTEMPHKVDIERVMGGTAKEPIRAYVGLAHAPAEMDEATAVAHRVQLAMGELDRLGAFGKFETLADGTTRMVEAPRRSILVAAPTSSGFVNPVAASSHEFMFGGDTATVTIQVGTTKAAGEMHHVARATATHEQLLEAVQARIAALPEGVEHPSIKVYGESFGAWTSQNAILGTGEGNLSGLARKMGKWNGEVSWVDGRTLTPEIGRERFRNLGIDRALYVGTPKFSMLRPGLAGVSELTGGANPPVRTVRNLIDTKALSAADTANTRVMFLQHDADPVGLFHPKLLWERPDWLGPAAMRGDNISPHQKYLPIVTGIQTALDQQMAQYFRQGVLEAKGHDYRSEVSYVMRRAFGAADVTDTQVARIREWNRQLEEIHMAHQAAQDAAAATAAAGAAAA